MGFKVVDRRAFTADGTPRTTTPAEKEPEPERPAVPRGASMTQPEPRLDEADEGGPADFDTLVSYLSTTAMFQLGLLAGPSGERIPPDLANAQRTIDLLEVLRKKTHGNLTRDEERLLADVLYELRMSFVEMSKRRAKKGK